MRLIGLLSATAVVLLLLSKGALCQGAPDIIWQVGGTLGVHSATFSHDGQTIVSGGWDETIKFWNVSDGRLRRTLTGHTSNVTAVAYSPDGQTLASASADYTAKLWRVSDGRLLRTFSHPWHVYDISWSPDGALVATACLDRIVRIWRASDGLLIRSLNFPYQYLSSVEFSPAGLYVAAGGGEGITAIKLWRLSDGLQVRSFSTDAEYLSDINFSPDGQMIASANGNTRKIEIWSVSTGRLVRTLTGHSGAVASVDFSSDGQMLACSSGEYENVVKLWAVPTWELIRTLPSHRFGLGSVEFSPDGQSVAATSYDVRVWNVADGTLRRAIGTTDRYLSGAAFTPDDRYVAVAGWGGSSGVAVYDAGDGSFVRDLPAEALTTLVISRDGQFYVTPGFTSRIDIRRFSDGSLYKSLSGHTERVYSVAFSHDGRYLISGAGRVRNVHGWISIYDCTVRIWRLSDGAQLRVLSDSKGPIYLVAITSDGTRIASAAGDEVRLWRFSDGALIRSISVSYSGLIRFSPDGLILAVAAGNQIRIYDANTGDFIRTLPGHASAVVALDFALTGNILASGDTDEAGANHTIKFWRVSSGELLLTYDDEVGAGIVSLAFSNDGRLFGYAREDHTLVVARNPFAPRVILPGSFLLTRGVLQSGGLAELFKSDDQRMVLRPGVVLSQAEAPIQLVLEGEAPMAEATELRFKLEAHASIPNIRQAIALFDFAANQWEDLDSRLATTSDTVAEVVVMANPSRFIQAGTNRLRARVSYKQAGPVVSYPWSARIDQAIWEILP